MCGQDRLEERRRDETATNRVSEQAGEKYQYPKDSFGCEPERSMQQQHRRNTVAGAANQQSISILRRQLLRWPKPSEDRVYRATGLFRGVANVGTDLAKDFFPVGNRYRGEIGAERGKITFNLYLVGHCGASCFSSTGSSKLPRPREKLTQASAMRRRRWRPAAVSE